MLKVDPRWYIRCLTVYIMVPRPKSIGPHSQETRGAIEGEGVKMLHAECCIIRVGNMDND